MRLALAFALLGTSALAQDLPALYAVTGVAANDVLNIRAEPAASAAKVGTIAANDSGVEVLALSPDGKWGLVSSAQVTGWVALRFLAALPSDPNAIPDTLTCLGTEPFWNLALSSQGASWSTPDETLPLSQSEAQAAPTGYLLAMTDATDRRFTLTIAREACSDGMSDRQYGLATTLFLQSPATNALLHGCCTLDPR